MLHVFQYRDWSGDIDTALVVSGPKKLTNKIIALWDEFRANRDTLFAAIETARISDNGYEAAIAALVDYETQLCAKYGITMQAAGPADRRDLITCFSQYLHQEHGMRVGEITKGWLT